MTMPYRWGSCSCFPHTKALYAAFNLLISPIILPQKTCFVYVVLLVIVRCIGLEEGSSWAMKGDRVNRRGDLLTQLQTSIRTLLYL